METISRSGVRCMLISAPKNDLPWQIWSVPMLSATLKASVRAASGPDASMSSLAVKYLLTMVDAIGGHQVLAVITRINRQLEELPCAFDEFVRPLPALRDIRLHQRADGRKLGRRSF